MKRRFFRLFRPVSGSLSDRAYPPIPSFVRLLNLPYCLFL
nr:MAG TPA: hypothetical protein [Caudoviricetes sp.]